jgi:hypothetical protein
MQRIADLLSTVTYDLCVLTGDYRDLTFGPFDRMLAGIAELSALIKTSIYGVLGNHDSILMLPGLERLGIRILLNESETGLFNAKFLIVAWWIPKPGFI